MIPASRKYQTCLRWIALFILQWLLITCKASGTEDALGSLSAWQAVEDLRVGSVDDPEYSLTRLSSLSVAEDGRMFTVHDREQIVRVFKEDGTLIGTIGGRGEGPGEFQGIGPIGWVGDSLWVLDRRSFRFNFFSTEGEFLSSFLVPFEFQMGPDDPFPPQPRGLLSDGTIHGSLSVGSRDIAEGKATHRHIVLLSRNGEIASLVDSIPLGRNVWQVSDPDHPRGMMMYPPQPFGDGPLWGIHLDEPALSILEREAPTGTEDAVFRLVKLSTQGDTVFVREYPYTPIPISSAEADSTLNANVQQWAEWGVMGGAPAGRLRMWADREFYAPSFRPPVTDMVIGRDGGYWLRGPLDDGKTVEWFCLDSSGTPIRSVRLPANLEVLSADTETIWGTESDELDVPYLIRFLVQKVRPRMPGVENGPTGTRPPHD